MLEVNDTIRMVINSVVILHLPMLEDVLLRLIQTLRRVKLNENRDSKEALQVCQIRAILHYQVPSRQQITT